MITKRLFKSVEFEARADRRTTGDCAPRVAMSGRTPWQVATQLLEVEWMMVLKGLRGALLPHRPTASSVDAPARTPSGDWFEEVDVDSSLAQWIKTQPGGVAVSYALIEAEITAGDYWRDRGTGQGDDRVFQTATYTDVAFVDVRCGCSECERAIEREKDT